MNKYIYGLLGTLRTIKRRYPESPPAIYKKLLVSQYWPVEDIISYQVDRLNTLLSKAKLNSEYYRQALKDTVLPIKSLKEFELQVPLITKEVIKQQPDKLRTQYFNLNFKHTSSGTTGDPITIYNSAHAEVYREAGFQRFLSWWKMNPYDNNVNIWGIKATAKTDPRLLGKLKSKLHNRYDMNVFDLNQKTIKKYFEELLQIKPRYIRGFKSAILQLAELIEENHLSTDRLKIKLAIVTAEVLMENERKYMEKILHCPVVNEYGSSDIGQIAFECPHGSMHIFEEAVYLYVNESKEIIATELYNDSMPLINYKNNDMATLSDTTCTCGRSSRIISQIEGRNDDLIIKHNGDKVSSIMLIYIMMELDDVGLGDSIFKWKVIQRKNKFRILIVPRNNYNQQVEDYIRRRYQEEFGKATDVEFSLVDDIPRDRSGKLRLYTRID